MKIGEIKKNGNHWDLQMYDGVLSFLTKKEAEEYLGQFFAPVSHHPIDFDKLFKNR